MSKQKISNMEMSNKKSKTTKEGHFYFTQDLKKKKIDDDFF